MIRDWASSSLELRPHYSSTHLLYNYPLPHTHTHTHTRPVTNYHRPRGLKQRKLILAQCQRPQAQYQGVTESQSESLSHAPVLVSGASKEYLAFFHYIVSVSASVFTSPSSLCLSLRPSSVSYKDTHHRVYGPA